MWVHICVDMWTDVCADMWMDMWMEVPGTRTPFSRLLGLVAALRPNLQGLKIYHVCGRVDRHAYGRVRGRVRRHAYGHVCGTTS